MQPDYQYPIKRQRNPLLRLVIISASLAVVVFFGFIIWNTFLNKKTIVLNPTIGTSIAFGSVAYSEGLPTIKEVFVETDTPLEIRVSPGQYGVLFYAAGFQQEFEQIEITENTTINTPELIYTTDKLSQLLNEEKPLIQASLTSKPELSGYNTVYERLYGRGDWYGAVLFPADINTQDILRVILQKENGSWKIAAGPSIIFFTGAYPDIPREVIRDINNATW